MSKVIYIAGVGRSGSTILDIVLGSHANFVSLGEIAHLLDFWIQGGRQCACGQDYRDCPFWRPFLETVPDPVPVFRVCRQVEKWSALPLLLSGRVGPQTRRVYQDYQRALIDHVQQQTGKQGGIIDSSKTTRLTSLRWLALQRLLGQEVYVIHLVRNGLDVLNSVSSKGSNQAIEGYQDIPFAVQRALISWLLINLGTMALGRLADGYLRLRHEDFLADPTRHLYDIGQLCEIDMSAVIAQVEQDAAFPTGHLIGGNRLRLAAGVRLQRPSSTPQRAGANLRPYQRWLFGFVAGWLNRYYGYS